MERAQRGNSGSGSVDLDPRRCHTTEEFGAVVDKMESNLEALLACDPFGRDGGRPKAPTTYGVYLFSELAGTGLNHLYVGRVGLTERARKKGAGHSNFRTRLHGHTRASSGHNQATFAFRLAVETVGDIHDLPVERAERAKHPTFAEAFLAQKSRVNAMQYRCVEIVDEFECYIFEPYAAYRLGTPYNSWATS